MPDLHTFVCLQTCRLLVCTCCRRCCKSSDGCCTPRRKRNRNAFVSSFVVPVASPGVLRTLVMAERGLTAELKFRCQRDRSYATRVRMTRHSVSCFPLLSCLSATPCGSQHVKLSLSGSAPCITTLVTATALVCAVGLAWCISHQEPGLQDHILYRGACVLLEAEAETADVIAKLIYRDLDDDEGALVDTLATLTRDFRVQLDPILPGQGRCERRQPWHAPARMGCASVPL
jgi:hypothetical protein